MLLRTYASVLYTYICRYSRFKKLSNVILGNFEGKTRGTDQDQHGNTFEYVNG